MPHPKACLFLTIGLKKSVTGANTFKGADLIFDFHLNTQCQSNLHSQFKLYLRILSEHCKTGADDLFYLLSKYRRLLQCFSRSLRQGVINSFKSRRSIGRIMNHISSTDLSLHKDSFHLIFWVTQNWIHYFFLLYLCLCVHRTSKRQGLKNPGGGAVRPGHSIFYTGPNICGSSAWGLLHVTILKSRILRWFLNFFKTFSPLGSRLSQLIQMHGVPPLREVECGPKNSPCFSDFSQKYFYVCSLHIFSRETSAGAAPNIFFFDFAKKRLKSARPVGL